MDDFLSLGPYYLGAYLRWDCLFLGFWLRQIQVMFWWVLVFCWRALVFSLLGFSVCFEGFIVMLMLQQAMFHFFGLNTHSSSLISSKNTKLPPGRSARRLPRLVQIIAQSTEHLGEKLCDEASHSRKRNVLSPRGLQKKALILGLR